MLPQHKEIIRVPNRRTRWAPGWCIWVLSVHPGWMVWCRHIAGVHCWSGLESPATARLCVNVTSAGLGWVDVSCFNGTPAESGGHLLCPFLIQVLLICNSYSGSWSSSHWGIGRSMSAYKDYSNRKSDAVWLLRLGHKKLHNSLWVLGCHNQGSPFSSQKGPFGDPEGQSSSGWADLRILNLQTYE